ncbi:ROK family glucokinase [Oceanobacillus chungangensis]|uniref:Glucokinase n=1 Tax=Oceanobacillus chungangensis TaxID=1229152 RepID=A0A3D8Q0F3_9BACI|nr:ROK family glucokinase [Oceanobacillus chungangensis]RDW21926.1 glucokinase [Oceanobacillus chungangensis]
MNEEILVGIDIGGTAVKLGFINSQGEILKKWEIPTNLANAGNGIIDDIWNSIKAQLDQVDIKNKTILGLGVGAPGFIEAKTGYVYVAVNIGWKDFDLAQKLKEKSGLPVFVENDANLAALGENWLGAGEQADNMIAITLGTGVGGGIIANGKALNGENGMSGEIGHITIDPNGYSCNCGRKGCLETIASATGIVRQAMDYINDNGNSSIAAFYEENGKLTAKDVFDLASEGDEGCEAIVNNTMEILGLTIANMCTIINPSKVLIGGGVSKAGDHLLTKITTAFEKYALPRIQEACEIRIAKLGNDAGIIGGAYLVKQKLKQ